MSFRDGERRRGTGVQRGGGCRDREGRDAGGDRTWLSFPDGTARREAVHVIHDLPHLVVESVFGLDEGLWGTLRGGFAPATGR